VFVAREPHGFNQKQSQFLQDRFFEVQRLVKEDGIRPQPGAYESFGTSPLVDRGIDALNGSGVFPGYDDRKRLTNYTPDDVGGVADSVRLAQAAGVSSAV
jgi:hypothetical protein